MATTLSVVTSSSFAGNYTKDSDLSNPAAAIRDVYSYQYVNGSSAGQANTIWLDTVAVTATPTAYDLTSGMTDEYGNAVTFTKINEIFVHSRSTTGSDYVQVGGNFLASLSLFTTGDYVIVYGGGDFHWRSPLIGVTIVNATNDAITLTGSTSMNVDLILIGIR